MAKSKKSVKSSKVNSKSSKVTRAPKAPKVDKWGYEIGSVQAAVNKLLRYQPQTVQEMAEAGDINPRRVRYQCRVLTRAKLAKRTGDPEALYAWRKGSK